MGLGVRLRRGPCDCAALERGGDIASAQTAPNKANGAPGLFRLGAPPILKPATLRSAHVAALRAVQREAAGAIAQTVRELDHIAHGARALIGERGVLLRHLID